MLQVQGQEGDQRPAAGHPEEWPSRHARLLPSVQHQSLPHRQGIEETRNPSRFGADARARHPKGMAGVLCLFPSLPIAVDGMAWRLPCAGGRLSAQGIYTGAVAFSARQGGQAVSTQQLQGIAFQDRSCLIPGQSGATRHPPCQIRGEKVLRLMGIGVQKEPGPTL